MESIAAHPLSGYTQAERDLIAKCLREGESANEIGARIGRSRNAVIGVVHRDKGLKAIGFARRPGDQVGCGKHQRNGTRPVRRQQPRQVAPRSIPRPSAKSTREPKQSEPQLAGRPQASLRANQCQYAVNDAGRGETHLFCGLPSDGMWCEFHRGLVYQPNTSLRDRRAT